VAMFKGSKEETFDKNLCTYD